MEGGEATVFKDIKKFFADLFNKFKEKKIAKFTPLIAIVCLLAILIPTLIAVWQVYFKENDELAVSDEVSVVLYDGTGATIAESSVSESSLNVSPLVDVFYNLYMNKSPVENAPDMSDKKPNYKVHLSYGETEIDFSCFFTENYENSYILDADGRFYTLESSYYAKFLDMEYSDSAYSSATPPTLITNDGDTVIPYLASWSYKKLDGTVRASDNFVTSGARHTYSASGSIGLNFSKDPDFCSVIVTDNLGKEIYHGGLNDLSTITASVGEHLKFSVEAEWNDNNDSDSFGSIKYDFDLLCKNLATFSISNSELSPGAYIVISAFDVEDGTSPTYTPDTSIDNPTNVFNYAGDDTASAYLSYIDALDFLESFKPVFFKDGNALKALLPIPYNTPEGDLTFTLSSGVATSTHTVKISSAVSPSVIPITSTSDDIGKIISKQAVDDVIDLAQSLNSSSRSDPLFRGEFLSPLSQNYTSEYSYGDRFTLGDEPLNKLSALGNAYFSTTSGGRRVLAANIGVVVKTGYATHLGNFAVIDHGGGLMTWYCNLGDLDVREGDAVAKGEVIGKSGESLLLDGNGVLILCTVNGSFVDPSLILGKEILYTTS